MKLTWLRASLALWKRREASRTRLLATAQHDLERARAQGTHPRQALVDRVSAREKQLEEARENVKARESQIAGLTRVVASPLAVILEDSWGYKPPVHDGLDLICNPSAVLFAICDAKVVRADASGWWGKGAHASSGHPVSDGDGIIVLRSRVNSGPFRKGQNFCYGHAEHATVRAGQVVKAGQVIGRAGFANAWHVHFMVNGRKDALGLGDRDPRPFVDYARRVPS